MAERGGGGAPRVSVVIACLDAVDTVGQQLEAVLAQQCDDAFEVVVADDGSVDGTPALLAAFADRGVRVVRTTGRTGPAAARNTAVAASRGQLIAICDADDLVHPGWLQGLVDALDGGADWAGGVNRHVDAAGGLLWEERELRRVGTARIPWTISGNCALPRAAWDRVGGFDEAFDCAEDLDLFVRLRQAGLGHGVLAEDAVVDYRQRPGLRATLRQRRAYGRGFARFMARHPGVVAESGLIRRLGRLAPLARPLLALLLLVRAALLGLAPGDRRRTVVLAERAAYQWGIAEHALLGRGTAAAIPPIPPSRGEVR